MTDVRYVTQHNPTAFFKALAEQIEQGFYADDSVSGYPHLDIINEVKVTRSDKPSQLKDYSSEEDTVTVTAWDNTTLILTYQDLVLQGFEVVDESVFISEMHGPHTLTVRRKAQKASKAPVSAPEPKAVPEPAPKVEDVPEAATVAPEPKVETPVRKKGGRPPKAKE